jgi:hypothetical protein
MTQYAIIDADSPEQTIFGIIEADSSKQALFSFTEEHLFWAERSGQPRAAVCIAVDDLADGRWRPVAPAEATEAGQTGGDTQVSEAWGKRFALRLTDGEWAVIEDAYYVDCPDALNGKMTEQSERWLENQIQYSTCTDLRDVGGTETWATIEYEDNGSGPDSTEEDAKRKADSLTADYYTWQGEMF